MTSWFFEIGFKRDALCNSNFSPFIRVDTLRGKSNLLCY